MTKKKSCPLSCTPPKPQCVNGYHRMIFGHIANVDPYCRSKKGSKQNTPNRNRSNDPFTNMLQPMTPAPSKKSIAINRSIPSVVPHKIPTLNDKAFVIAGDTYQKRREIKSMGGRWNPDEKGWILPKSKEQEAKNYAKSNNFAFYDTIVKADAFDKLEGEKLRAYRNERNQRKADRLISQANTKQRNIDKINGSIPSYANDWAFITQPITNNSGGRSFARLKERLRDKEDKKYELYKEKESLLERVENLQRPAAIKGDAEQRRRTEAAKMDTKVRVGSVVTDVFRNTGTITKINKNTYTIEYNHTMRDAGLPGGDTKRKYAIGKTFIKEIHQY